MDMIPEFTLSVTRTLSAPRSVVWRYWTEAALLKQWYCPAPWTMPEADLVVRPGGRANMIMAGPDGERIEIIGSYLEVVDNERLIFTDSYAEGFIPRPDSFMTGVVELSEAAGHRTQMVWSARHATAEQRDQHLETGFSDGWNAAVDQLEALLTSLPHADSHVPDSPEISAIVNALMNHFTMGGTDAGLVLHQQYSVSDSVSLVALKNDLITQPAVKSLLAQFQQNPFDYEVQMDLEVQLKRALEKHPVLQQAG